MDAEKLFKEVEKKSIERGYYQLGRRILRENLLTNEQDLLKLQEIIEQLSSEL